jgi:hypothetical protein
MSNPELPRDELAAVVEARRELGKEYEPALVESFIDRLDQVIDARIRAGLAERGRSEAERASALRGQMQLGIGSLALGIPLSGIAGGTSGVWGLLACWGGIAAVNLSFALGRLRGRPRSHD